MFYMYELHLKKLIAMSVLPKKINSTLKMNQIIKPWHLKPMDSFVTWRKWKLIFVVVNAEFYRVVWTINALLTVRSDMLPFSGNNQNIKKNWSPPEHFAIGYVHNDNLPLRNIALQYVIQNNCMNVWWCFLMISCTFWRSRQILLDSPSCGFKF